MRFCNVPLQYSRQCHRSDAVQAVQSGQGPPAVPAKYEHLRGLGTWLMLAY